MSLYSYIPRQLPGPGVGNFAFMPTHGLPALTAGGPGRSPRENLRATQPPQLYYGQAQGTEAIAGGGVIAGQFVSHGLIDFEAYLANIASAQR